MWKEDIIKKEDRIKVGDDEIIGNVGCFYIGDEHKNLISKCIWIKV